LRRVATRLGRLGRRVGGLVRRWRLGGRSLREFRCDVDYDMRAGMAKILRASCDAEVRAAVVWGASAKAHVQRRGASRSAEALLPPHECGGSLQKLAGRPAKMRRRMRKILGTGGVATPVARGCVIMGDYREENLSR
jgi:hypothetical protein